MFAPVGNGLGDGGGCLAQHTDDLPGPLLLSRVQLKHTFGVAEQMSRALLDSGELDVELVAAGIVVADQVTGVARKHAQAGEGGLGPGSRSACTRPAAHQGCAR